MLDLVLLAEHPYSDHGLDVSPSDLPVVSMLMHATSYTLYMTHTSWIPAWEPSKCPGAYAYAHMPMRMRRLGLNVRSMQLNEIAPGLEARLPPTDTRWRRDLRALETGDYAEVGQPPFEQHSTHHCSQHMVRMCR